MAKNPKGDLIELSQREGHGNPEFLTLVTGPEHKPAFTSEVYIAGEKLGYGEASTKKRAEHLAAEEAIEKLKDGFPTENAPFDGPWPIFPDVLAASLTTANSRVAKNKLGQDGVNQVAELALELYKTLLENLGDVVDVEEEV